MEHQLSQDQVRTRIETYQCSQTTDEIYDFGRMLLAEEIARTRATESKAMSTAGYTAAVLAFVLSRFPAFPHMVWWTRDLAVVIAALAASGIALAVWALRVEDKRWFSDEEWLENEMGIDENADLRKRFYIVAMHDVKVEMGRHNIEKATFVKWAQGCLGTAGVFAALLIALQTFYAWR